MNLNLSHDEQSMVLEQSYSMNNSVVVQSYHSIDDPSIPMGDFLSRLIRYCSCLERDVIHRHRSCEFFLHVERHYFDDVHDNHINNIGKFLIDDLWKTKSDERSK